MNRAIRHTLAAAGSTLALFGGEMAATASAADTCSLVRGEGARKVDPDLAANIGRLADDGITVRVQILDDPERYHFKSRADIAQYQHDLAAKCDTSNNTHGIDVTVDKTSGLANVDEYFNADDEAAVADPQDIADLYQDLADGLPAQLEIGDFLASVDGGIQVRRQAAEGTSDTQVYVGLGVGVAIALLIVGAGGSFKRPPGSSPRSAEDGSIIPGPVDGGHHSSHGSGDAGGHH